MSCPPDTDAKRLARFYLYRKIKKLFAVSVHPRGVAVVLAGSEASEIGCLRHYLPFVPNKAFFVDTDEEGLVEVHRLWPKAQTFHGTIRDALKSLREKIAFLNLDFCGYMNNRVVEAVSEAAGKIEVGGVVAYTYLRSREQSHTPNWQQVEKTAEALLRKSNLNLVRGTAEWMDAVRFLGYSESLRNRLGSNFVNIFRIRYSASSSMGIIALQNMPRKFQNAEWRRELDFHRSEDEELGILYDDNAAREKLRDIAMSLTDRLQPNHVADILHLPSTTVSAWQAHKTRGTYGLNRS